MIGISAIGSHVPDRRDSNFARMEQFSIDEEFIRDKIGVVSVARKEEAEDTSDLCVQALADLEERLGRGMGEIECLIVCTQNPDAEGLPHTSAIVQDKAGIADTCACFDISLGCSGYVYGLSVIKGFMQENGMSRGLLFTCDPYSKIIDPQDKNTALLFGDAATVTLLERYGEASCWVPGPFVFGTRGSGAEALQKVNGTLNMNGRAVFNFSAVDVPRQIDRLLSENGLGVDDVDLFLFHQGSKFIVDQLSKRLRLPAEKVPSNLRDHGNTVSSSLPLLLQERLDDPGLQRMLLSGFGVGLSWASCLLTRRR